MVPDHFFALRRIKGATEGASWHSQLTNQPPFQRQAEARAEAALINKRPNSIIKISVIGIAINRGIGSNLVFGIEHNRPK